MSYISQISTIFYISFQVTWIENGDTRSPQSNVFEYQHKCNKLKLSEIY